MAITYYGLWMMDLFFKFNYCLLFVLFYLYFLIDVCTWCAAKRLQLNAGKTEIFWFGKLARQ